MLKNLKKKKNNKGFTLVELLVVIAIIGILAVVAVPSLFKNIDKAKVAEATSYINAVKTSAVSVYADTHTVDAGTALAQVDGKTPDDITITSVEVNSSGNLRIVVTVAEGKTSLKTSLEEQFDGDSSIEIK